MARAMMIKQFETSTEDIGKRLDVFLLEKLPKFSRSHIKKLIEENHVSLNGKDVSKAGQLLKAGMRVIVEIKEPEKISTDAENIPIDIIYEDADLLVINKPQGMVVHPCTSTKSGTLVNALLFHVKDLSGINGKLRPGIVHRLDKETSGLLLVAKNDFSHRLLAEQIKNRTCHRRYLALLEGNLKEEEGRIQTFIKRDEKDRKKMAVASTGREAITDFKVVKHFEKCCLVEFVLQTGRTHQIRVHAKYIHHPVVGDKVYGHEVKGLEGQLLHAYKISFTHPRTNESMSFQVSLPAYFESYLKKQTEIKED